MAKYFVDGQDLTDIANAIRERTGKSANMEFPDEFVSEIEGIGGGITPTGTINITQNGTTDVTQYASANVAVPNSYAAADEGKVVSNGALVAQSNTSVSANGTYDTTMNKQVTVAVPASAVDSGTKNITANGNNQDVVGYATVNVNVPNSYGSSDEGKVVSNGALVAQGSDTVTQNGTVDTTLINSLTVNVSGGGGNEDIDWTPIKPVTFVDYDGTILYTYTAAEFLALSAMPANPSHDGLTAQGWNATLAEAQAYVQANGTLCIGQNYTTSDGKTRIYITVVPENVGLNYCINMTISNKNGVVIDWGDGNTTTCDANNNTNKSYTHVYSVSGDYVITITANTGTYILGRNGTNSGIFWISSIADTPATASTIVAIRIGNNVNQIYRTGFGYCGNLETISIPTTMLYFGESSSNARVFYDNVQSLKCLVFPRSSILYGEGNNGPINNMRALRFISYAPSMTVQELSVASNGLTAQLLYKLRMFTSPSDSQFSGGTMFFNAPNLEYASVPGTYTTLTGGFLREVYMLEKFTVPATVTTISQRAMGSSLLKELHMLPTTPPTLENTNAMPNTLRLTIYVPYSADHSVLTAYKSATNWSSFSSIIQEEVA